MSVAASTGMAADAEVKWLRILYALVKVLTSVSQVEGVYDVLNKTRGMQAELQQSNEHLRPVNRDLEVFAYSASQDLQEPLRPIAISAELIEQGWGSQLTGADAGFLSNIVSAARRVSSLIEDLLAYIGAGKSEEAPSPIVDSDQAWSGVLANLKNMIDETGTSVSANILPLVVISLSYFTTWLVMP